MTTEIEMTKLGIYQWLSLLKKSDRRSPYLENTIDVFESELEGHLEALRKDLDFAYKSVDVMDAKIRLTLQQRDDFRNRLQAFEFANKAAGEELRAANEVINRQREYISEMWGTAKAHESQSGTLAQDSRGNVSETICGPFYGQCQHSFRTQYNFTSGKTQKQCVFCMLTIED